MFFYRILYSFLTYVTIPKDRIGTNCYEQYFITWFRALMFYCSYFEGLQCACEDSRMCFRGIHHISIDSTGIERFLSIHPDVEHAE